MTTIETPPESERLERFLRDAGTDVRIRTWDALAGGRSATSVKLGLRVGGRDVDAVLHVQPDDGPLAGISSARDQYALLDRLAATPVRAPRVLWFVPDSVLGRPAFVTNYAHGAAPDPWRASGRRFLAEHPTGGPLADAFVARMAEIHAAPVTALPDAFVAAARRRPFAEREQERWSTALRRSPVFSRDPLLVYADAWLRANRPAEGEAALVHGDYRMGNLVVDGEDVVAVLDWELAIVGDPLYDVATVCSPALLVDGRAGGLWDAEAFVRRYEEHSGRAVDRGALAYYRILSTFKIACLWVNASSSGAEAPDLAAARAGYSALDSRPLLAEALGLPADAPTGPGDRTLAEVHRALRDAIGDPRSAGEDARLGLAILSARARVGRAALPSSFPGAVDALAADARVEGVVDPCPAADRLADVATSLMNRRDVATDPAHPLHRRLRELIGAAAHTDVAGWYAHDRGEAP